MTTFSFLVLGSLKQAILKEANWFQNDKNTLLVTLRCLEFTDCSCTFAPGDWERNACNVTHYQGPLTSSKEETRPWERG